MKKSIKFLAGAILLVSLCLNLFSFISDVPVQRVDEHILVEIYEVPSYEEKGIYIHYGGDRSEVIPFHEFEKENHLKNGDLIIQAINRLEREGYDLTHVSSGLANSGMITKVWMVKRH